MALKRRAVKTKCHTRTRIPARVRDTHHGGCSAPHLIVAQILGHYAPQQLLILFGIRRRLYSRVALELLQRDGVQREQLVLQLRRVHLPQGEVVWLHLHNV
jgi:hypothetical protein